ncbi:hypothetical protein EUTSA_v10000023mg [Eutrema salsugineum]|uniref:ADP-ribosyl cyclase/cyclic ADP-ribose hydrolase n=1 Tax=Eutrema salsugineum TaxID=72664 RepID=V4LR44_EUTSA|nr:disease resistance protein ADR2 [Eutrema salsugineum]ESQ46284.1 hypothetical protein EUTSA_v10000023mg [Eutrema salsugineum]
MASSSSSSTLRTWRYNVFTSFHGPDVRKSFLSHLRKQFNYNGITMFDDQGIERSQIIAPALTQAIRESRISIVLLSKNYASSGWCLDELLEILNCKEDLGQIVMTVFYGVNPSDVRKQSGDFGFAFNETCSRKTEEESRNWSKALTYVGNIAGEHSQNWDNEAEMIEKIATDVSNKLNATPSRDFDGMVGLEAHLTEMESLLDLEYDGAKIVGISGHAGIGKSTIARALHNLLSDRFQHSCFMDNLRENYKIGGIVEYGLKLRLQEQLLSQVLKQNRISIRHSDVIQDRLCDQKVLIILDDVESLDQLEALAEISWFGPGSRVIVTTENEVILQQHGINDIYHVRFPSRSEALMIFCLSAFKQTFPPDGFMDLANEVARICGNLPLGLHVLGSSLRGKSRADWIDELPRLQNCLDGRIESVLKVGYESLYEKDQVLFLLIAVFFNNRHVDCVTSVLSNTNLLDVKLGLKNLANRYLIHKDHRGVVMHRLLQVMARKVISKQEPSKRQILVDAQEICDVLEKAEGNRSNFAVSFDVSEINGLKINKKAFKRMCNLLILKVYNGSHGRERQLHVPEELKFPHSLRLLHWEAYPRKSFRICPENLVKLNMRHSQLEKLWEGTQQLANLKEMNFSWSSRLKELPDLSNATNLERLDLFECTALVELPSSVSKLHKLYHLETNRCTSLQVIPTLINLVFLKAINMMGCSRLTSFPDIPTSIIKLSVMETAIEELPTSLRHFSFLESFDIRDNVNIKTFSTDLPTSVTHVFLCNSGIQRITEDCIKGLHNLQLLDISGCKRLTSLPELPCSLKWLRANHCESLERVSGGSLNTPNAELDFSNCLKLCRQARRAIIQQWFDGGWALLPGRKVPTEFDHRARGDSLTITHPGFYRFKVCVVISAEFDHQARDVTIVSRLLCRCRFIGHLINSTDIKFVLSDVSKNRMEHLLIFQILNMPSFNPSSRGIVLEFISRYKDFDILECGVKILTDETEKSNHWTCGDEYEDNDLWDTHELQESSSEKEDIDDDSVAKSESGEASKDKVEDIADDSCDVESISKKRPRKNWILCLFLFLLCFAFARILDLF